MITVMKNALPDFLGKETGWDVKLVYRETEEDRRTYSPKGDCYDKRIQAYGDMSFKEWDEERIKG